MPDRLPTGLGRFAAAGPPETWVDHYGVFLVDEKTPFPTAEYPLVRALQGQPTDNVEMFIRNPQVPEGVLIAVTGRPQHDETGAISGATVVFRDITQLRRAERALEAANEQLREARRREAELATFIVHDLRGPLTGIVANTSSLVAHQPPGARGEALMDSHLCAQTMERMLFRPAGCVSGRRGRPGARTGGRPDR